MDFYYDEKSPPCRGPMLTAKALGIELNLKPVNLMAGEHLKPEYLAINPQHTIPALVDGDFKLAESRAIAAYLVNQYGKDDSLYPKDPKKRAVVDRMLYFDMGTLYARFADYLYPILFEGAKEVPENLEKLHEALGMFEGFLKDKFVAGPTPTIADHSMVASVSTFVAGGIDLKSYPKINAWLANCKASLPGYDQNEEGVKNFGELAKSKSTA